eukprot:Pgem_evm1s18951
MISNTELGKIEKRNSHSTIESASNISCLSSEEIENMVDTIVNGNEPVQNIIQRVISVKLSPSAKPRLGKEEVHELTTI